MMPIAVVLFSERRFDEMTSISISYWSDSHDLFVGSLVAVAVFLAAYNGTGDCKKDMEYWLSKFACVFALLVAIFPTENFNENFEGLPGWIHPVTDIIPPNFIHFPAAVLLFVCLILLMAFFSQRAKNKGAYYRAIIYLSISLTMLVSLPTIFLIGKLTDWYAEVFVVEFVGLWLFGFGWSVSGWYTDFSPNGEDRKVTVIDKVDVDPYQMNIETKVVLEGGVTYKFEAKGCWMDWFLACGPDGWGPDWKLFTSRNRMKGQPFFKLCGNIGKDEGTNFDIGSNREWEAPIDIDDLPLDERRLNLFANDWETKYENNETLNPKDGGPLTVKISRLV